MSQDRDLSDRLLSLHIREGSQLLPQPLGFSRSREFHTSFDPMMYPHGYAVSRVQIEDNYITILIGLGALPAQSKVYIRTLLVNLRKEDDKSRPVAGIRLEGDPLNTKAKHRFGLRPSMFEGNDLANFEICERVSQVVYKGLRLYASADGCVVNGRLALSFFGDGYIDHTIKRAMQACSLVEAIQRVIIPDDTFDLNYQVALGIHDVESKYQGEDLHSVSLAERLHKAGLLDNPDSFDQMYMGFGLKPESFTELGYFGPIKIGSKTVSFSYHGTDRGKRSFCYARSHDFHDPVLWGKNGFTTGSLHYFRAGLFGFDIGVNNDLNAHKFRSYGVTIVAPYRLRFLNLAERQAEAWDCFIAEAVKMYDLMGRNNRARARAYVELPR
jgi:hypothetical protein